MKKILLILTLFTNCYIPKSHPFLTELVAPKKFLDLKQQEPRFKTAQIEVALLKKDIESIPVSLLNLDTGQKAAGAYSTCIFTLTGSLAGFVFATAILEQNLKLNPNAYITALTTAAGTAIGLYFGILINRGIAFGATRCVQYDLLTVAVADQNNSQQLIADVVEIFSDSARPRIIASQQLANIHFKLLEILAIVRQTTLKNKKYDGSELDKKIVTLLQIVREALIIINNDPSYLQESFPTVCTELDKAFTN